MITVSKFTKKRKTVVGQYPGTTKNMKDIFTALELARKECPKGKLIVEGVTVPERLKKVPEIK